MSTASSEYTDGSEVDNEEFYEDVSILMSTGQTSKTYVHVHACIVLSQIYMYIIQSSGNLDAQP